MGVQSNQYYRGFLSLFLSFLVLTLFFALVRVGFLFLWLPLTYFAADYRGQPVHAVLQPLELISQLIHFNIASGRLVATAARLLMALARINFLMTAWPGRTAMAEADAMRADAVSDYAQIVFTVRNVRRHKPRRLQ